MNLYSDFCFIGPGDYWVRSEGGQNIQLKSAGDWAGGESPDSQRGDYFEQHPEFTLFTASSRPPPCREIGHSYTSGVNCKVGRKGKCYTAKDCPPAVWGILVLLVFWVLSTKCYGRHLSYVFSLASPTFFFIYAFVCVCINKCSCLCCINFSLQTLQML